MIRDWLFTIRLMLHGSSRPMSSWRHQSVNCVIRNRLTPWCHLRLSGRAVKTQRCRTFPKSPTGDWASRCRQAPIPKSAALKKIKIKKASFQNMYIQAPELCKYATWNTLDNPRSDKCVHYQGTHTHTHANICTSAYIITHANIPT